MTKISTFPQKTNTRPTRTKFTLFEKYEKDPKKPDLPRRRYLRFDVNALADFEQETGMGFAQLMQQKATFAAGRALAWAGLKHEDRLLTIEDVGKLMSQYMTDESGDEHSINSFLLVVLQAGVEQGAFAKIKEPDPESDEDDIETEEPKQIEGVDPNVPAVEGQVIPSSNSESEG